VPAPYSADLRKRIIDAYNNNEGTLCGTADRFRVSVKFVRNPADRFRKENTAEPRRKKGGKPRAVSPDDEIILKELLKQESDPAPEQLCLKFREKTGKTAGVPAMRRSPERMGITRKKKHSMIP